jgi:hypothetical protein
VELGAFVSEARSSGAKFREVLGGLWNDVIVKLEDDAASLV